MHARELAAPQTKIRICYSSIARIQSSDYPISWIWNSRLCWSFLPALEASP